MKKTHNTQIRLILPSGVKELKGSPEELSDLINRYVQEEKELGDSWAEVIDFPLRGIYAHPSQAVENV